MLSLASKVKGALRIGGMLKRSRDNTSGQYENGITDRKIKGPGKSRDGKIKGWGSRDKTLSSIKGQNQCIAARGTQKEIKSRDNTMGYTKKAAPNDVFKGQDQGIKIKGSEQGNTPRTEEIKETLRKLWWMCNKWKCMTLEGQSDENTGPLKITSLSLAALVLWQSTTHRDTSF